MASEKYSTSLVWIRRDLRLEDHVALSEACQRSRRLVVGFVFDSEILVHLKDKRDRRLQFIHNSILELDTFLRSQGSQLVVRVGNPTEEIPKLASSLKVDAVFFNEDYEPYARQRDEKVKELLAKQNIKNHSFKDHVVFAGYEVKKGDGKPYQVFTPYKKAWLNQVTPQHYSEKKCQTVHYAPAQDIKKYSAFPSLADLGFEACELPLPFQKPGRKAGLQALKVFSQAISRYDQDRDYPALSQGTSGISVHLRFGTVSIRECVRLAMKSSSKGSQTWLSELIWRDFFQMILFQYPHIEHQSFKAQYNKLAWSGKEEHFKAWCQGQTGFPIVDAAMRQLNQTGFMHNRLRMVVASFLVKDLLIDWRKGEAYFAEKLLDFDLAANNGGWQWSASTGCDAQPYFRIFHPVNQSKKFDSNGDFIRFWVPELQKLSAAAIHFPAEAKPKDIPTGFQIGKSYPHPIVDHAKQRLAALKMFKRI